jgi:hypothetical protein
VELSLGGPVSSLNDPEYAPRLQFLGTPAPTLMTPMCLFILRSQLNFKQNIMINCIFKQFSLHLIQWLQYINTVSGRNFPSGINI